MLKVLAVGIVRMPAEVKLVGVFGQLRQETAHARKIKPAGQ